MILLEHAIVGRSTFLTDLSQILSILRDESVDEKSLVVKDSNGGYGNTNFIVYTTDKPHIKLFVRLANPRMKFYLRNNKRNYKFYSDQGLSASMHCLFGNGCIMDVLEGTALTIQTDSPLYEPDIQRAVAEEVARYHTDEVLNEAKRCGFEIGIGWHEPEWFNQLFDGLDKYRKTKDASQKPLLLPTASEILTELNYLSRKLDERESPLVFCHGDLNPSNIVYNEKSNRATFVDYDSPCITHAVFDIAVHFLAFQDVFNIRHDPPSEEYRRKWLFHYLTKKNELNGICTFAPVSDGEIDRYMDDLKIAKLKAVLHFTSCFSWILNDLALPEKTLNPDWLASVVSECWAYYKEQKQLLDV